jgi:hypothetical protein
MHHNSLVDLYRLANLWISYCLELFQHLLCEHVIFDIVSHVILEVHGLLIAIWIVSPILTITAFLNAIIWRIHSQGLHHFLVWDILSRCKLYQG